jgi:hypothetical protein
MSSACRDSMNCGLRRLDRRRPDGAAQERQVHKAGGRDVGSHGRTGSRWNPGEPADHGRRQDHGRQSAHGQPPGGRPIALFGDSHGGHGFREHGVHRTGVSTPERLSAGCGRSLIYPVPRAAAERDQLLARPEPVAREGHYVAGGPRLFAAVLGFRAFRFHPVAVLLYRICRSFPPNRGGFRPPGPVVYPSELVPVRLN